MTINEHLTAGLASAWDCTTREVDTRVAAKRKRSLRESNREDIPWTAARCNRLLRTITSRINILRKQSKLGLEPLASSKANNDRTSTQPYLETPPSSGKSAKFPAKDPAWIPGAKSRTNARTYSSRSGTQGKLLPKRQDSGFSTPFVKRLLSAEEPSTLKRCGGHLSFEPRRGKAKGSRQLPVQLASSNEEAQRNLVTAFGGLLAATNSHVDQNRIGARSLRASCLRQVPEYIRIETDEIDKDDDEHEDVTSSVYSDLESLGTNIEGGWSGLREVVRAHCIYHVQTAIEEGLIHEVRITELIRTCNQSHALREADVLLHSWIKRGQDHKSTRLRESHASFALIDEIRSTNGAESWHLRFQAELVRRDYVWASDFLRTGSTLLKDLIRSLVRGSVKDAALAYLENAVVRDYDARDSSSLPIFTRLAGLLASIALTKSSDTEALAGLDVAAVVHRIAGVVLQRRSLESARERGRSEHPFVMASTILQLSAQPAEPCLASSDIGSMIAAINAQPSAFIKFLCNVGNHMFRFSNVNRIESLLMITSGFFNPPAGCNDKQRDVLTRLAFEVASAYSEQTGVDLEHHLADILAIARTTNDSSVAQTPRRRARVSGFRWEEGLCEWVAATPQHGTSETISLHDDTMDQPVQLLTPKPDRSRDYSRNTRQAILSSPDIIADEQVMSRRFEPAMPVKEVVESAVLRERPANIRPAKQVHFELDKQKGALKHVDRSPPRRISTSFERQRQAIRPIASPPGKQVHLKLERQKKAAREAELAALAPSQLQQSNSIAGLRGQDGNPKPCLDIDESDELGILTPARKKLRGSMLPLKSAPLRKGLPPSRSLDSDVLSDDELGL